MFMEILMIISWVHVFPSLKLMVNQYLDLGTGRDPFLKFIEIKVITSC